ncbi:MAG: GntR family transcriptional regulator [Candidatus Bipolaricaulia bacterium]
MTRDLLYRQVYDRLLAEIRSGAYKPGARLPNHENLAAAYGVSLVTVKEALRLLEDDGLIQRWPKRGTFVAADLLEKIGGNLSGFAADIARDLPNITVRTLVVEQEAPTGWIAEAFREIHPPVVTHIRRRHYLDSEPVMCTDHYVPIGLTNDDLVGVDSWMYFRAFLVHTHKVLPVRMEAEVWADTARGRIATELRIPKGTPILHLQKVFYDVNGTPCESLAAVARTDRWRFRASSQLGPFAGHQTMNSNGASW